MSRILFLFTCALCFLSQISIAQQTKKEKKISDSLSTIEAFKNTGDDSFYPGGDLKLSKNIHDKLSFTTEQIKSLAQGNLMANLTIERDSTISSIYLIKDPGNGWKDECIMILKSLKFSPKKMRGIPIRSDLIIEVPITAIRK